MWTVWYAPSFRVHYFCARLSRANTSRPAEKEVGPGPTLAGHRQAGYRRACCELGDPRRVCGVSARARSTFLKPAAAPSASAAAALLRVVDLAAQCYADDRKLRQLSPAAVSCSDSDGRTDPWRWLSPTRRRRNDCPRPLPVRRRRWTWSLRRPPECSSC